MIGLKKLGHDILFLEDSDDFPGCYNPGTFEVTTNAEYGLDFLKNIFSAHELNDRWAYYDAHTGSWFGKTKKEVMEFCGSADLAINLSGVNPLREWWASIPNRMLLDTDPAFTQIKHLTDDAALHAAKAHTHFATYGENFGRQGCSIPDDGIAWKPTRQPVCIEQWHVGNAKENANWTTLMQWDSYRMGEYNGKKYGMKSMSFQPYLSLPQKMPGENLELALGSKNAPRAELENMGWIITDPTHPSVSPVSFQEYINNSKGEWSIAKHGYVVSNSGWFSERSLNYMASGKPVVVQDTGFTRFIPTGNGVFSFTNLEEAVEGIKRADMDYVFHCRKAREVVEEYFESGKVLRELISSI
jgi:hypothetical protein